MVINYLAIILGAILNIIFARVWYGLLFKNLWRELTNRTPDEKPEKNQMFIAAIFAILMSLGVNIVVSSFGIESYSSSIIAGLILGFLFITPIVLGEWIWDKKSFTLVSLNAGFYTLYFVFIFILFVTLN